MPEEEFFKKFQEITDVLSNYGWIISPYMIGKDFEKVYTLALKIKANSCPTVSEKEEYQNKINEILTDVIFHPNFRAFFIVRSKEVKYINHVSHHLERATLHYYKNDYFSAVLCLLPAIESSLLSYYGWNFQQGRKPNIDKLIQEIEKCRENTFDNRSYHMYSKSISSFLKKWIYSDTSTADTSFSYLNRHYVLHGMGSNNYYSLADVQRLLMLFDLLIEFFSIEQNIHYVFIPDNNNNLDARREYYLRIIQNNIKFKEMIQIESAFLSENTEYKEEQNLPNWNKMMSNALNEYLQIFEELNSIKKSSS